jgi:hypothetical protein
MPKVSKGYSLDHAYKFYKEKHFSRGKEYQMTKKQYRDICYAFNKMIIEEICKGKLFPLPFNCGTLWVKKTKKDPDKPILDHHTTKKLGKKVYFTNIHSDGYVGMISWSRRKYVMKNLIYYSFRASGSEAWKVSEIFKQPGGHKRFFSR